jgi:hypothetical protein
MAVPKTRTQVRQAIRLRGGWTTSLRVTDALLNNIIDEAVQELWDLLVGKWADYYTVESTQVATPGNPLIFSNVGWYKIRKLELDVSGNASGEWVRVKPTSVDGIHLYARANRARYYIRDQGLRLVPTPTVADRFRLHYIPPALLYGDDEDTIDFINGYESIVIQKSKLAVETELKLDTTDTLRRVAELEARIRTAADGQDAGDPFYLDPRGPADDLDDEVDEWA